jgi:hypothetical protein
VYVSVPASAQQTRIDAPSGIGAGSITNSPITFGLKPDEQIRLVEVFSQQIMVSVEARTKAEVRAAELGTQLGVTQQAVIGFFRIVGEQDVPLEQVPVKLGEIAARHRAILDRWSVFDTADSATAVLAASAKAAIDAGRYDEADALLLRAGELETTAARHAEQLARDAQQAAERRWLRAAETAGKRGDLAMTRLRYEEAASHYAIAAATVPAAHQNERRQYLSQEADALQHQGLERGDNKAAASAITRFRDLVAMTDRVAAPLDWWAAQNGLALALAALGERESGTAHLEEAAAISRRVLKETTRQREPLQRAVTQMALGATLVVLGGRESGTTRLEEGVAAYRAVLEEITRDRVPLAWAGVQTTLGTALTALGIREGGTTRLEEAVAVYHAALEEITRERDSFMWATTQTALAFTLMTLGDRESGTARLSDAGRCRVEATEDPWRFTLRAAGLPEVSAILLPSPPPGRLGWTGRRWVC